MSEPKPSDDEATAGEEGEPWVLRIYVSDDTPRAKLAVANLRRLCEEHLPGRFRIEVIDIETDPGAAFRDGIVAIPTVSRRNPLPVRTLIGTLTDTARALDQLDLAERPETAVKGEDH
ncbi:MAG: circadian clock protein KaiB [Armatimonadetes bacterium]|nr:circadian clock protein KaiB [Armatimonadota bacterium]